jgi:hypothetical protein
MDERETAQGNAAIWRDQTVHAALCGMSITAR